VGCPWQLSNGEHGGVRSGTGVVKRWRRKKGGGCSLYSRQRWWNEGGLVVELWVANNSGSHSWDIVGAVLVPMSGQ
jgi:hypothetical protein